MDRSEVIHVDGLDVAITFRSVKRMNVRVHPPQGEVRLSVPPGTPRGSVVRFVRECRPWIDRHRLRIERTEREAARRPPSPPLIGAPGERWRHFGRAFTLEVHPDQGRPRVGVLPGGRLVVHVADPGDSSMVRSVLDRWERRELRTVATALLRTWESRMGVHHDFLGLRRMSTRWGSCVPSRRRIWLNLALVSREVLLIEYVVVHELAHLLVASHGPEFRAIMDTHLPDWRERRVALDAS